MAVPAHDSRDYAFARHFGLEIIPVVEGGDIEKESYDAKSGKLINSDLLDGLDVKEAIGRILGEIERRGLGRRLVNYRLRDAIFSRQRYWGEPFPIYYKEGTAYPLPEERLPLELPPIDNFGPTEQGEPPLARVKEWTTPEGYPLEVSTMPGFAGSSAYYLRYMDPHNDRALVGRAANEYWRNVDLYVGGIEHATGHLMYSRFWNMFLYDLGYVCEPEPFKKLVNQGMIQGRSNFSSSRGRHQQIRIARTERPVQNPGDPRRCEHRAQRHTRSRRVPRMAPRIQGCGVHPSKRAGTSAAGRSKRCRSRCSTS